MRLQKNIISSGSGGSKRNLRVRWEDLQSAFENRIRTGIIINITHKQPYAFLEDARHLLAARVKNILKKINLIKVNMTLCCEFIKMVNNEEVSYTKYFSAFNSSIDVATDFKVWYTDLFEEKIMLELEEFQEKDSGFALQSILDFEVNINKVEFSLRGSSYIELSSKI